MHFIRANGAGRGWTLKSVVVNGRDVTDAPLDLRGGQTLANVSLLFTDRLTSLDTLRRVEDLEDDDDEDETGEEVAATTSAVRA